MKNRRADGFVRRFARDRLAVAGLAVLLLIAALALGAGWLFEESPWAMVAEPLLPPFSVAAHPLGTDMLGRDIAACLVYGARMSLLVGLVASAASLALGVLVGALAGYLGGRADAVLMAITEFFQIVPPLALILLLMATFTPTLASTTLAIAIVSWPALARLVRAECMALREREFVQAALLGGERPLAIMFGQVLPNAMAPVLVSVALLMASAILTESALSFLGLGVPDTMSWGLMIGAARSMLRQAWWLSLWPGLAIVVTVLAINVVGDGLKQALNAASARSQDGAPALREAA